ncbi:TPA: glycosyltransferase family 2 protein [Morganella morganii subsp. morganii]|nr:glycosyltransferase family 2 protein [Morganella morganii subsp. morganii]
MITIITPAYNAERNIVKLYNNLQPLINDQIQWIIVNDKSTDNTKNEIDKIKNENVISYTLDKNQGPQYARYYGILRSKTKFIFLLDADDLIYNQNFKEFIEFIKKNPTYDFYYSILKAVNDVKHFTPNENFIERREIEIKTPYNFIFTSLPHPSSLVINKEFYLKTHIDCNLAWGEDIYMYLILSQHGKGIRWIKPVSCYINNGLGRGSKLSISSRFNLSLALFKESFKAKRVSSFSFSLYMSIRYLVSYCYKKFRS